MRRAKGGLGAHLGCGRNGTHGGGGGSSPAAASWLPVRLGACWSQSLHLPLGFVFPQKPPAQPGPASPLSAGQPGHHGHQNQASFCDAICLKSSLQRVVGSPAGPWSEE